MKNILCKILFSLLIIYVVILILEKINIINFISTICCILKPLFIGIIITLILNPIKKYLIKKGMNKIFSIIFIYIIIVFILYMFIIKFLPLFLKEISNFIGEFPNYIDEINIIKPYKEDIIKYISDYINNINNAIPSTCYNIISSVFNILIGFVISFYLLISDKFSISKYIGEENSKLLIKIELILKNYIKATLFSSLIVFALSAIFFYLIKIKNPLVNGLLCGITNIIPYIGPYIGATLPILVAFSISTTKGIIAITGIFIIQLVEGNVINPIIISKSIDVHPVVSIISLIIFSHFCGIFGMIIACPTVAIIKEVYLYIKKRYNHIEVNYE